MGSVTQLLSHLFLPLRQHTDRNLASMKKGKAPREKDDGNSGGVTVWTTETSVGSRRGSPVLPRLMEKPHLRSY